MFHHVPLDVPERQLKMFYRYEDKGNKKRRSHKRNEFASRKSILRIIFEAGYK